MAPPPPRTGLSVAELVDAPAAFFASAVLDSEGAVGHRFVHWDGAATDVGTYGRLAAGGLAW